MFFRKIAEFGRLVSVVLLMDMRTRFGASYLSYLIAIGWPLSHLLIITGAYLIKTAVAPIGDSPAIFVGTGVIPYILCIYPARLSGMSVSQGKNLLGLPILKPIHLIVARWIQEVLNAVLVLSIFILGLYLGEVDFFPLDTLTAAQAIFASIYLGIGMGVLLAVLTAVAGPYFMLVFTLFMVVLYIFSGAYIPYTSLPTELREVIIYNPLFNIVEWLRSAYYTIDNSEIVNKTLVIGVASACLSLGLLGERYLRGKFLL